jgi:hypothetical protein
VYAIPPPGRAAILSRDGGFCPPWMFFVCFARTYKGRLEEISHGVIWSLLSTNTVILEGLADLRNMGSAQEKRLL